MSYPWLDVPFLTAPMLIAIIALLHVFVSHYAVGGGLILAVENWRSFHNGDELYRKYWKKHAKFFILLTVVYGAITGVGIWWTIGLASPLATEKLISIFAFGWAIEWCFFLLELVAGFALYYFWDKMSEGASAFVGFVYAFSAWISLVLITGITAFMLNSEGLINDWESTGNFWDAFLNVQFLPQTIARTGGALTLGSIYVLLHVSACEKDEDIRAQVVKNVRIPAFLGIFFLLVGLVGWLFFLPDSSKATLERAAATNLFTGFFVAVIFSIVLLLIVGPVARPRKVSFGLSLALFLFGIAAVGIAEFVREAVRKPYVVDRVVYSHQIARTDVSMLRKEGLLYNGVWTSWYLDELQKKYSELKISAEKYLPEEEYQKRKPFHFEAPVYAVPEKVTEENPAPENNSTQENSAPEQSGKTEQLKNEQSEKSTAPKNEGEQTTSYDGATLLINKTVAQNEQNGSPFKPASGQQRISAQKNNAADRSQQQSQETSKVQNTNLQTDQQLDQQPKKNNVDITGGASVEQESAGTIVANVAESTNVEKFSAETKTDTVDQNNQEEAPSDETEKYVPIVVAARDVEVNGKIERGNEDLLKVSDEDRLALGRVIFLHHCNACHASTHGYSAVAPLISGRTREEIKNLALTLNHANFYMPPWSGVEVEAELLAEYLESIAPKYPTNVFRESKPKKEKNVPKADAEEGLEEGNNDGSDDIVETPDGVTEGTKTEQSSVQDTRQNATTEGK